MTPDRTWDPLRFQRGTRGFAAFVTALNGFAVLGASLVVAPAAGLPAPLDAWIIILGTAAGIGHLVAAAVFALLMIARANEAILGAADATAIGFFLWMIGTWLVATRFARKAYTRPMVATTFAAA